MNDPLASRLHAAVEMANLTREFLLNGRGKTSAQAFSGWLR
jgi:hypothetical protein